MPAQETGNTSPKNGARKKGRSQAAWGQTDDNADALANGSDARTDAPKDAPLLALAASDTPQATASGSEPATPVLSDSPRDAGQGMPWLLAAADSERDAERSADKPSPVPASGGSMGSALAVGAGLLLAAAAGGGGSSNNNSNNNSNNGNNNNGSNDGGNNGGSTPPPGNTPSDPKPPIITPLALSIDQVAGDDVVNAAEKAAGVTVSGTTSAAAGQTVTVLWGTSSKTATVVAGADGRGNYTPSARWTLNTNTQNVGSYGRDLSMAALVDLNGDGQLDTVGTGNQVAFGRGDGTFAQATVAVSDAGLAADRFHIALVDVNADGRLDMVYVDTNNTLVVGVQNADGSFINQAAGMGWDAGGAVTATALINSDAPVYEGLTGVSTAIELVDVNNDRSLDLVVMGPTKYQVTSNVVLNPTAVAENTFLRVMVANDHGGLDAYGALVRLYDHASGALVAVRQASTNSMAALGNAGSYGADFFGLDPLKSYDISVVYPGSDKGVTVLTGKAGLGVGNVAPGALNQIVDSSLNGVTPGGKDVVWVAKENRSTSTTGGYWQGSGLADQMVGDAGNDVFKPNGARVGEAGDTLSGGGGKDRYIFDVKEVLNTPATITDFSASAGADADSLDLGVLLTSLGYSGARTAAGVASWVNLVDSGGNTTLQIDAHSGTNGAASGFVDVVKLNGVTGKTLATLVSGGFVHLGGVQLGGIASDQVVTETLSMAGVPLAAAATLAAEGGQWAAGFSGGKLQVSLDNATANDTLGLGSGAGVSYDAASRAVKIGSTQVATVDSTYNGVGAVGKLAMVFDFSGAGASYSTEAQQAAAVQTVLQSIKLTSSTNAPLALDRGITFSVSDALGDTQDLYSGLRITPEANSATLGGVNSITGTESVETLTGTTANETFVGYNGVPTAANTASLGSVYTFGDTLTGGGGQDTFKWLKLQTMNSDAIDKITDFGLKGGSGSGQGATEADVIDLTDLLQGYSNSSTVSDYVRAVNVGGKVQIQVDTNGKANGTGFESSWFMTLENLTVNANNEVLANSATISATAAGLSGKLTVDTLVQQMVADSQFKLL